MALSVNNHLLKIDSVLHGSSFDTEILDFSASIIKQPLPLSELLQKIEIHRYPDSESSLFRKTIADSCGLKPENVLAGNGSSELFMYIALAFINCSTNVGALKPAYGEYKRVTQISNGNYLEYELSAENKFDINVSQLTSFITQNKITVFFLTNPNNPTGRMLEQNQLIKLIEKHADVLFVLDLAYHDYALERLDYQTLTRDNVFLVHSLTKNCGLAGLRCGYVTSTETNISILNRIKLPWNLNSLAQAAGCWVLENRELCLQKVKLLKDEAVILSDYIRQTGFYVTDSVTDYFVVKCNNPKEIQQKLLNNKILVRDTSSQGLPGYLRITVKEPEQNQKFKEIWKLVIENSFR